MSKVIFAFFSFIACITGLLIPVSGAYQFSPESEQEGLNNKTVLVIVDYADFMDLKNCTFVNKLMDESYLALISNRQSGKSGQDKSKLIIGSGKRLEIGNIVQEGGNSEKAREAYRLNTENPARKENVLYTEIVELINQNINSGYVGYIGYLGSIVKAGKGSTCILGNSDTDERNRSAILIAMDGSGIVDYGEVDGVLLPDSAFPYGKRTDYNKLVELYKQFLPASSFMVIDTGDMERLETKRQKIYEWMFNGYKEDTLKRIDNFIEEIYRNGGFNNLMILSSYPSRSNYLKNDRLTPLIVYNGKGKGLLHSDSTRRNGIVLNTDLADYILECTGFNNQSVISEVYEDNPLEFLININANIVGVSVLRFPVLTFYAIFVIVSLVFLLIVLLYSRQKRNYTAIRGARILSYCNLIIPFVFLYMPLLGIFNVYRFIAAAFLQAVLIALMLDLLIYDGIKKIIVLTLFLVIGMSVDISSGSLLIKQSVLGYDPIIGARFYGIGNEYAGIFIGSSLLLLGSFLEIVSGAPKKIFIVLFMLFCTLMLGFTTLGANFGGALAGLTGYLLAYFLTYDIEFNRKNIMNAAIIAVAFAFSMAAADLTGITSKSHVGIIITDTGENGFRVIISTVRRKIAMNLRLIKSTIWTKVLVCIILAIVFTFIKPLRLTGKVYKRYKYVKNAWIAVSAASIAGFFANDSGIVLAATAMIYVGFTLLPVCIDLKGD
ncbi:MAG: hypothetical protein ACM3TR_19550 [Caulobacteraceae bacterium]